MKAATCYGFTHVVFVIRGVDVCGLAAPIVAGFKIDLRELVNSSYDWQTPALTPTDHNEWLKNFDLMTELSTCTWPRSIIPTDCASNEVEFIGCGDASQNIVCAVCYIRTLKTDGTYSCQIVLSKTKLGCSRASPFLVARKVSLKERLTFQSDQFSTYFSLESLFKL